MFLVFTGALGSTDVAKDNWEGLAIGAAISGIMVVIGKNVVGMDPRAEIKNGAVVSSHELERRVKCFQEWFTGAGGIILRQNVEDTRLRSAEYAIEKLGVNCIELKWGQGAKDIGGEVKLKTIERAEDLKKRGYIVLPDPEDKTVKKAFAEEEFKEFERHSRLGMVEQEGFSRGFRLSEDRGVPRIGPGAGDPVLLGRGGRSADHRRRGRRHRHEPLAHDERVGHPDHLSPGPGP
jgi:hypothetical protein